MGKKAKLKQLKKNGQTYNLLHYTKDLYLEVFPEASANDYHAYLLTNEVSLVREQEKKRDLYISTIRHVVIGDAYSDWLKEYNFENTYENRTAYAQTLTDKEVVDLWAAFQKETETRFIPFVAVSENEELIDQTSISREQIEEAKGILAQGLQAKKEAISLHPKFLSHEETQENFVSKTVSSEEENGKCIVRFLAITLNDTRNAIQTRKEFEQGRWTEKKLPHVSLTTWAEKVWNHLPENAEAISVPGLLAPTQTKDFSEAFQQNLQQINA